MEAALKLIAFGKNYFRDGWNTFDFIIVLGSILGQVLKMLTPIDFGSTTLVVRSFRIARVLKLFKGAQSLKVIISTMTLSLPAMANVGALLALFLYIFSILGVFLFSEVQHSGFMSYHANFMHVGRAALVLYRATTGENWHRIMEAVSRKRDLDF